MTRVQLGRRTTAVLAAATVVTLGVSGAEAAAQPVVPATGPTVAGADPTPAGTDGPIVILHTDSGADARSDELRAAAERLGAHVRHTFGAQQALSLQLPAGSSAAADDLAALPGVTDVEHNVRRSFTATPNDPQYSAQRGYLDAVTAPTAWDRQRGSSAVRIAVVDSGVDVDHPDLKGKVVGRYNALTRSTSVTDVAGHGTFVAGVAAARTGNGVGVAGAAYNTSILAVKVADGDGDIAIDDEVAGIRWAADHGANVINLSLSGPDASDAERRAVAYAQTKGAVVVAAAGNEHTTARQYPAAYPGVIAVAATDLGTRRRASFSNHGSWVTLAAPGVNLVSTTPRSGSTFFPGRSGYARGSGTSFATPLVAAAAALVKAQNPKASAATIRAAVIASAHGYGGNDIGRGQVDFALALQHVAPTTTPTSTSVGGTSGSVTLQAASTAPRVSFRVDGGRYLPSVAVVGGVGRTPWSSYGYAQGRHTVSAVDCSSFGQCAATPRSSQFTLDNAAPAMDPPGRVSGPSTITATAPGGGLRLLVDGKEVGFDPAAPFSFAVNGSQFADGQHRVSVQNCTVTHASCAGPASPVTDVTFDSLHPQASSISRTAISPNGDGSGDTATLTITVPAGDAESTAEVHTVDPAGVVRRVDQLGVLTAGPHSWVWRGLDAAGHRLRDGRYRLVVVTSKTDPYRTRYGSAGRDVALDTVAPRLRPLSGGNMTFYPVRDGYRDTFVPTTSLPDGGLLRLVITTATGRTVRVMSADRGATARTSLSWNGYTSAGRLAGAGAYRWSFSASDPAGNVTRSATYRVTVSTKRLRTRTVSLVRDAKTKSARGSAHCAGRTGSRYRHGLHLVNSCSSRSEEVAYATYVLRVPAAYRYGRLRLDVYGRAATTSRLNGLFARTDGGLEVPAATTMKARKKGWRTIASVSPTARISHGTVRVTLLLTPHYRGANDFDARSVRLRVTVTRLV